MNRIIKIIDNETIEIARYEDAKATYDINNTNDDICIFKEVVNPFQLYEENQRLKKIENFKFSLRKDETKSLPIVTKNYKNEYEDYKSRIDKAIEYIGKHSNSFSVLDTISNAELLKILKGSDKE